MPKRDDAVSSKRSASRHTAKAKAAGRANLAKGRAKKAEETRKAREQGTPRAGERWARLLDGSLSIEDLDDDEIKNMRVRGADGGFSGKRRPLPSHIAQAFHRESIRRANERFRTAAPEAVKALIEIGTDPEVNESARIRALMFVVERSLGKMPETVRVEGMSAFDRLTAEAVGLDRDMADLAGRLGDKDVDEEGAS